MIKEDFSDYVLTLMSGHDLWDEVKFVSFDAIQKVFNTKDKPDYCDFYATKNGSILEVKPFIQNKKQIEYNYIKDFVYILDEQMICLRSELQ
jgi:hypothetical protein